MRRTASMAGLPVDRRHPEEPPPPELAVPRLGNRPPAPPPAASPRKRHTVDLITAETALFLRFCGLCDRRLGPGRDTFIYRGEIAFCSLECREQQISHDERMEKCSLASMKTETPMTAPGSEAPVSGEAVVAA